VLDTVLQAYRVAEQVSLPVMVNLDGVYLSHTSEPVLIPDQVLVDQYLPKRQTKYKLDPERPYAVGGVPGFLGPAMDVNTTTRRRIQEAMEIAKVVAKRAMEEFNSTFGRSYGVLECQQTDDAEVILVTSATIDRNISLGHCGVFVMETKAAMYNEEKRPPIFGFITGICGLPVTPSMVAEIVNYTCQHDEPEGEIIWEGIKP